MGSIEEVVTGMNNAFAGFVKEISDIHSRVQQMWDHFREAHKLSKTTRDVPPDRKRVKLNVGGTQFHTTEATLLREQETIFHSLLRTQPGEDGEYFIDRSPAAFGAIMHYLRTGNVVEELYCGVEDVLSSDIDYYKILSFSKVRTISKPRKFPTEIASIPWFPEPDPTDISVTLVDTHTLMRKKQLQGPAVYLMEYDDRNEILRWRVQARSFNEEKVQDGGFAGLGPADNPDSKSVKVFAFLQGSWIENGRAARFAEPHTTESRSVTFVWNRKEATLTVTVGTDCTKVVKLPHNIMYTPIVYCNPQAQFTSFIIEEAT